ncbi:metallophosphoesterase [Paenactinomyces guangxiensis]|uniref:Metallophosphoesterase n=1 Tax=Paenactinomyces guangxiensis TaxID=1490290 RepID=A0A7W1WRX9_9BACL|nr:metallophosphoesterase [Paenactinomyces guangxiensis]MBA4494948.1 metallophosphoesterase [Paenactinomyces guangxiensis]MBH8592031.1 metallophosphoesterase [Paenactinomyces guangxiensis]
MAIYALSDLHLSFNKPVSLYGVDPAADIEKPMDVFGWDRHYDRIRDHWLATVQPEDTVLIPGDISWAMKLDEARHDFDWIRQLPGKKIMSPGNHCYYAQSKKKVRQALPEGMEWIDADYTMAEGRAIAATRGWNLPGDRFYKQKEDRKIYERQVGRLRIALEAAHREHPEAEKIVMLHFPPLTRHATESGFMDLMKEYGVPLCVYGHMHGNAADEAIQGVVDGIELKLVACDALDFCPVRLR